MRYFAGKIFQLKIELLALIGPYGQLDFFPFFHRLTVYRKHPLARLYSRLLRGLALINGSDPGMFRVNRNLDADHENEPKQGKSKKQVHQRTGKAYRQPVSRRLGVETPFRRDVRQVGLGLVGFLLGPGQVLLAHHLHVAPKRDHGKAVVGLAPFEFESEQSLAKAQREPYHVDVGKLCGNEMPQLVHENQRSEHNDKAAGADYETYEIEIIHL